MEMTWKCAYYHCDLKTVIEELQNQREVQTRPIWGLIHEQRPYRNALAYRIEKADYYSRRIINIPCSTQLAMQEMELVVEAIRDIIGKHIH